MHGIGLQGIKREARSHRQCISCNVGLQSIDQFQRIPNSVSINTRTVWIVITWDKKKTDEHKNKNKNVFMLCVDILCNAATKGGDKDQCK